VSTGAALLAAGIPSPTEGVWHLGPVPLRAYALCIIAGAALGIWLGNRRWLARGGAPGAVADVCAWALPFGLVGARLYHVVTDYQRYFGPGGHPVDALKIWQGGLGIWGGVAFGVLGAWIGARRHGILLPPMADALAPGVAVAQAVGRLGNWFNQELFGRPTSLPWGVQIDPAHRPAGYAADPLFQPTFLYELLWCLGVAALCIWADRRFRLGHGRVFALYVFSYTVGRAWIEALRIDDAHHLGPFRLNDVTAVVVGLGAVVAFVVSARRHPGRETDLTRRSARRPSGPAPESATENEAPEGSSPDADRTVESPEGGR